ncbi:MAG: outer membrane protein transport protein [Gammaproteobacteria bacterium]|nr:outer membrane protein transport protein [Gammaproteobacteria bacterium]
MRYIQFNPKFIACITSLLIAQYSYASGFSLYTESNGEAVGNFAAGIAAEPNDASIGWYNPAGLSLLHHDQILVSGVGVLPSSQLSGNTTYQSDNFFDPTSPFIYNETFSNLQGAQSAVVPSLHMMHPVGPDTTLGLSIVSPFGLSTDWDPTSALRYEATYTKLMTLDVAPEIGGRLTDHLAGGLGFDFEYANVTFNRVLGSPAVMSAIDYPATIIDSSSHNQGSSFGIGFHGGLILHINDNHSRLGVNYQSPVNHQFEGYSQLSGRLADPNLNAADPLDSNPNAISRSDNLFSNTVSLPGITTVSVYQDMNERLALLGSVVYTTWGCFQNVKLFNVAAAAANPETLEIRQVNVDAVTEENYRDTWRVALGANYKIHDRFMLRVGGGFEQTPTDNIERDVRLPDANRWAASVGAHYQFKPAIGLDVGYTHLFFEQNYINKTDLIHTSTFNVTATPHNYGDLVGAQLVWTMD